MVTSDKTGDEDTESAINELADDLLKDDSESVTDALEQALESVRAKDAQEELDRLLRAGKSLSSMKSKITAVCKPEYVAGSEYDRTQLDEMLLALRGTCERPVGRPAVKTNNNKQRRTPRRLRRDSCRGVFCVRMSAGVFAKRDAVDWTQERRPGDAGKNCEKNL